MEHPVLTGAILMLAACVAVLTLFERLHLPALLAYLLVVCSSARVGRTIPRVSLPGLRPLTRRPSRDGYRRREFVLSRPAACISLVPVNWLLAPGMHHGYQAAYCAGDSPQTNPV